MTVEHRILLGIADLKAVVCLCTKCGARLSIKPADIKVKSLESCPACGRSWVRLDIGSHGHHFRPSVKLLEAILEMATMSETDTTESGVTILFEFEDPNG